MIQAAALFMGTCSGHGYGNGAKFQPGHGGGMVPGQQGMFGNGIPSPATGPRLY